MSNTYPLSDGTRLKKANIDANIRYHKSLFIHREVNEAGRQYCWACGTTRERLTISHIISVNDCQKLGKSELAWDENNMQLECTGCHRAWEDKDKFWEHANYLVKKKYIENNFKELYIKLYGND